MSYHSLLARLEKGLRILSGLALALLLFQGLGVLMYVLTAWPEMSDRPSNGIIILVCVAVTAALLRSCLWVGIYWNGASLLSILRVSIDPSDLPEGLLPSLRKLTRLLVASCMLDLLLLPAIFLMDQFFRFNVSSVHLGLVQLASMLFPQAFGLAALILAYLTHQYGRFMKERCQMKTDLELTI